MTYQTFVENMLGQFPFLREECLGYMDEEEPLPYIALGAVFIPWLELRLKERDLFQIAKACAFIEDTAKYGERDFELNQLLGVEIGEWLIAAPERHLLISHFGTSTCRACRYHIDRLPK
jgi:hypothetical protein